MPKKQWHAMALKEVLLHFKTSSEGLSIDEATRRLKKYGLNELPEKKATSGLRIFVRQFANSMIAVLIVAAMITFVLKEISDTIVIAVAIGLNVIIGFIQEYRAEHALAALMHVIAEEATVMRLGKRMRIPRTQVVPGDIFLLTSGDRIAADARVVSVTEFEANEAIITGESIPQEKQIRSLKSEARLGEQKNIVYAGTVVTRGTATAVVVATGLSTEIGTIAAALQETTEEQTPLQRKLASFSWWIAVGVIVLAVLIFCLGVIVQRPWVEMMTVAVALAVAAIPEGLVVGVTAILAIGMHRLIKENAVVRRLLAAEILGSTTVICTDKTGTLTEGDMRLGKVVLFKEDVDVAKMDVSLLSSEIRRLVTVALAANESVMEQENGEVRVFGSPTERGIMLGFHEMGAERDAFVHDMQRLDLVPFSSDRKYSAVLVAHEKNNELYVVGAPDRLLERCSHMASGDDRIQLNKEDRDAWEKKIDSFGSHGWRLVAVASRSFPADVRKVSNEEQQLQKLTLHGFLALHDPLRQGAKEMIQLAEHAGVRTIMITGDHRSTAAHIGAALGLPAGEENIIEGRVLATLTDDEVAERIERISIYARMVPSEKVRIVAALQRRGEVVAMTGDGVNDAPALQNADIGVAVGTATDVAKEAADLVILDNNFGTIVRAIQEGRIIMDNVRTVALYLLSDSFSEIILIAGALVIQGPLPLLAKQILWINLVTDGFPNLALTLDPGDPAVMDEKPIDRDAPLLDGERQVLISVISFVTGFANLLLFLIAWQWTGDIAHARTLVFASLGIDSLLYVFSCRSMRRPLWRSHCFNNPYLLLAIVGGFALQVAALYAPPLQRLLETQPLSVFEWSVVFGLSLLVIALIEGIKLVAMWFRRPHRARVIQQKTWNASL